MNNNSIIMVQHHDGRHHRANISKWYIMDDEAEEVADEDVESVVPSEEPSDADTLGEEDSEDDEDETDEDEDS
jgi:hypothetical protein